VSAVHIFILLEVTRCDTKSSFMKYGGLCRFSVTQTHTHIHTQVGWAAREHTHRISKVLE